MAYDPYDVTQPTPVNMAKSTLSRPPSTLEEIEKRISEAVHRIFVVRESLTNLGDRAFGEVPTGKAPTNTTDATSQVGKCFDALDRLHSGLTELEDAEARLRTLV